MDLTALCDTYVKVKMTPMDAIFFGWFGEDVAFACHFVATHQSPTLKSATGIGYASKNYLKCREVQLTIHPIVGEWIDYK